MAYVTASHVADWDVSAEQVIRPPPHANMASTALSTMDRDQPPGPALIRFVDDGNGYFSSLPLIDGWLPGWRPNSVRARSRT